MSFDLTQALYAAPLAAIWYVYGRSRQREMTRSLDAKAEAVENGLTEPASLHPIIDQGKCMGCGSCVKACPEGEILGLINGRAELLEPSECIGHGACKAACPFDAITLVFGTETRGVELPVVNPDFQTNVPGLYIAGELGGMGLIRNAIEQGRQAMESIAARRGPKAPDMLDVLIVGAGPSGFSASLAAMEKGLSFKTLEQETLGGTVAHFPRGKLVMTQPAKLPIVGQVNFRETSKEELLGFWQRVQRKTGLVINFEEPVEAIKPLGAKGAGFEVRSKRGTYRARSVLLCIGRRGTPRKLGVPGEDSTKVVYRLINAEQYRGQHVIVVGGGDSAIEAATSIAAEPGTTVTLSYRGEAFGRCKVKNRVNIENARREGRVNILFNSAIKSISNGAVRIEVSGRAMDLENDAVIVCAGGILPAGFLRSIGVEIEMKHGTE